MKGNGKQERYRYTLDNIYSLRHRDKAEMLLHSEFYFPS